MTKRDLLLEICLEELPARFVTNAMKQLADNIQKWLKEERIEFGEVKSFSTPRRLAVLINDLSEKQLDIKEELRGPAKKIAQTETGEWSKAAIGFTRGQGLTVDDIYFKEVKGVDYVHVTKEIKGAQTESLLTELKSLVLDLHFPINMRWGDNNLRYIRPIKSLICLYGDSVIPFAITNVETGRKTAGHRFLGQEVTIDAPNNYESLLAEEFVVADPDKRRNLILDQIKAIESEKDWLVDIDQDLLEEVNNLLEYPTALYGEFDEGYLQLPEEVLVTSMREHQRYFAVRNKGGDLLPYFITVRNGDDKHLDIVAAGNEKVLKARLADSQFFFDEDKKTPLAEFLEKLESVVYHEEIGTITNKMARVKRLSTSFSQNLALADADKKAAERVAEICKFDLVTLMVNEFPELQGLMGEKYAKLYGEDELVAKAINDHYKPRFAGDKTPEANVSALVSFADKLDTVTSFFAIDLIPSGSQDPYALRRQASGIVEILLNKKWELKLEGILETSLKELAEDGVLKEEISTVKSKLVNFFRLRLKHKLAELDIDHDIVEAVLDDREIGSVIQLVEHAKILQAKKGTEDFKLSVEALSRILNIARNQEKTAEISRSLFEKDVEAVLYDKLNSVEKQLSETSVAEEQLRLLTGLQDAINNYFEETMVMVEDEKLRQNRINVMVYGAEIISRFANFNKIISK